jgi:hypothetical protein
VPALRNSPKPPARVIRRGSRILKPAPVTAGGGGTVTFDAAGPSSAGTGFTTSPGTWTHVNGGNGILVGVTVFTGSTDTVTAVTYGGVALASLGFAAVGGSVGGISFWGLTGPTCPTGSNTVSVTVSDGTNNHNAGSISVSAAGTLGTVFSNSATTGTSLGVTVNGTTTGGLIVSVCCNGSGGTITIGTGTRQWMHLGSTSSGADNGAGATVPSAGGGANQTLTWSASPSDHWGVVAVEVLPGAAAGGLLPGQLRSRGTRGQAPDAGTRATFT